MLDKAPYTPGMREVLKLSKAEAGRFAHDYIGPEHYLLGLIRKGDGLALRVLVNLGVNLEELKESVVLQLDRRPPSAEIYGLYSPNADAKRVLETSKAFAQEMKHGWVGTEHLLLALFMVEDTAAYRALRSFGLDLDALKREVEKVIEVSESGSPLSFQEAGATQAPENSIPLQPLHDDAGRVGIVVAARTEHEFASRIPQLLTRLGCPCETLVVSMVWIANEAAQFLEEVRQHDWRVMIVVAGREVAAPAFIANLCQIPVIALPLVEKRALGQAPMAVVDTGAWREAALFALRIMALHSSALASNLAMYERARLAAQVPIWPASASENPPAFSTINVPASPTECAKVHAPAPAPHSRPEEAFPVSFGDSDEPVTIRPVDFSRPLQGPSAKHAESPAGESSPPPPRKLGRRRVNADVPDVDLIEDAVDCLLEGGAIALPTDTVYGLAVDATNAQAVARLYELKNRPSSKAIVLLIDSPRQLASIACNITMELRRLMEAFWPGPLTMIFEKRTGSFAHITGDQTIGVRLPDHPVPLALIQALARPLACTSANLSGEPDALTSETVARAFGDGLDCLLDAGVLPQATPSTVLDVTREPYRILRQGSVTHDQIAAIVGDKLESARE